jgi:hypothetical protein
MIACSDLTRLGRSSSLGDECVGVSMAVRREDAEVRTRDRVLAV